MSATFGCPYCGATYPVKPVLVGRPVRCTTCKQAFRLRADGVADKVETATAATAEAAAPAATRAPTTPPPRETPRPATGRTAAPAAPTVDPVTPPPATRAAPPRPPTRAGALNDAQEQARRSLAANLSTIAEQALKAEEKKQSSERIKRHSDRLARQQAKPTAEGGVGDIGPAVLTGSGQRDQRDRRMWALGCLGIIALVALVVWLTQLSSAERSALRAFTEPVDPAHNGPGRRKAAIVERAWLTTVPPLIELPDVRLGSRRTVPMSGAKPLFAQLAGLDLVADRGLWVARDKLGELAKRWDARKDPASNAQALAKDGIAVVLRQDLARHLVDDGGLDQDEAEVVLRFFIAPTAAGEAIAKRLAAGDVPNALQFTPFHGASGELLFDIGGTYKRRTVQYEGHLLRFVGQGWPSEWRIADARTVSRDL